VDEGRKSLYKFVPKSFTSVRGQRYNEFAFGRAIRFIITEAFKIVLRLELFLFYGTNYPVQAFQ